MIDDQEGAAPSRPYEVGYDEAEMGDSVPREEFEHDPKWAQDKFSKLAYQRKLERQRADKAEGKAEAAVAQANALAQRLAELESKFNTSPLAEKPKQGIDAVEDGQLREYKSRAYGWMQRAAADPNDDAAKAEVAKIDFSKLSLVDEELARRAALKPVQDLEQRLTQREQMSAQQNALTTKLRLKYSDEVMDLNSPLMTRAVEIAREMARDYNLPAVDAGTSIAAIDRAYKELNGRNTPGREISEADRRRLSMEAGGGGRRGPPAIDVDAARKRGDWKSVVAATENNIDSFFDGMGLPR